jgi:hypothetical protein
MALDIVGPANAPNAVTTRPGDTRSFGVSDTWMKDCTSSVANDGTKVQAGFVNALIGQFRNLIRGNGLTGASAEIVVQNNADDNMALKAVQHLIQRGQPSFASDTGTANAVVVAMSPAMAEHKLGTTVRVLIAANNTGAATITINALSAKNIKRLGGGALQPFDLQAASIVELAYDGTQYQIISCLLPPLGGSTQKAPKLIGFLADTVGGGGTVVPTSVATLMAFNNMAKNNLWGTSTFTGNTTLTIGAGEAGIWNLNAAVHMPLLGTGFFEQILFWQNDVQVFTGTTTTSTAGGGSYVAVSCNRAVNVGDTLKVAIYHQYGSNLTTVPDQTTNFSAMLISAY